MNKVSYALGLGIGQQLKSMGAQDLCIDDFAQAIKDVLENKELAVSHHEAQSIVTQYMILQEGDGKSPKATDKVRCHYEGMLIDGTLFDSSLQRGEPADFPLNGVIAGWTEGLQLMKEGAKYRFFIPYLLGYGAGGAGNSIPPYSTLIFDVELIKVL